MHNAGKDVRVKKGYSQEDLADFAKVNVRTIQRLENNQNQPHPKTLNLICQALDINAEDIIDYGKKEDQNYLVIFNLTVLSFIIIPLGNIIIPLILWMTKKDKIIGLKKMGANLLNFQIVWTFMFYSCFTFFAIMKIMHYAFAEFLFYGSVILGILNVVLSISFALKINKGKAKNTYPSLIKIIG